jgi:hypothetical protein
VLRVEPLETALPAAEDAEDDSAQAGLLAETPED